MPKHSHVETASAYGYSGWAKDITDNYCVIHNYGEGDYHGPNETINMVTGLPTYSSTANEGGNQSHNNIQPYITVYMWKRTA